MKTINLISTALVTLGSFCVHCLGQESTVQSTVSKTQISDSTIRDLNWHSLNDVLYKQAGFFPSQDYERATVGSRGIPEGWNNNHLQLLIDGIPFNTGLYGTALTNEFTPLAFTKSLEITKGPGMASNGRFALNGSVALNTVSASDFASNKVFANLSAGERNTMFHNFLLTYRTKPLDITASFNFISNKGDNYLSCDGSLEFDTLTGSLKMLNPDFHRSGGYFFVKLEGRESIEGLSLQVHSQVTNSGTGYGWLWNIANENEKVRDNNTSAVLKYRKKIAPFLNVEAAVKYTLGNLDWNIWYYRTEALNHYNPYGVNEVLKTSWQNLFGRVKLEFLLPKESSLVLAAEPEAFIYSGDKQHYSNIDLFSSTGGQITSYETVPLGPVLEPILDRPVKNIGSYAEFCSGRLLSRFVQLNAGVRYDYQYFNYIDPDDVSQAVQSKSYGGFAPRISLRVAPTSRLSIYLIGTTGYRPPVPAELFGSNTWLLASNLTELEPEHVQSAELIASYAIGKSWQVKANLFYTEADGLIGYSLTNNNLNTNLYNLTNAGIEGEVLFSKGTFSAFANAAFVKRIHEEVPVSELLYVSVEDHLTWAPAVTANIGLIKHFDPFTFSIQGHYQDKVLRRELDLYTSEELGNMGYPEQPRISVVESWISLDARFTYRYNHLEFGISGTNLLDSENYLIKSMKFPFDYKMEGRRISLLLNIEI